MNRRSRRKLTWLVLAGLALGVFLSVKDYKDVSINSWHVSEDGQILILSLNSCNAELLSEVVEEADSVTLTILDETAPLIRMSGDDCADQLTIVLQDPLAGRSVIDASTGAAVP